MELNTVTVPPRIVAGVRRHAAAALPLECCGALIGLPGTGCLEIRALIPLPNAAASADFYRIDADTVLRVELQASRTGQQVVGFYHSHPTGGALPSAADLELACPGYVYLIAVPGGDLRAWRLREDRGGFDELPLVSPVAGAA